jgi:hypothetical protein
MTASTTGFGRFAGLLFSACLALLLIPAQARAADPLTISVGGVEYAIQFFQNSSFSDNSAVLQAAPWWGDFVLAGQFRDAYRANITFPVLFDNSIGVSALLFAFETGQSYFYVYDPNIGEYGDYVDVLAPSVTYQSVIAYRSNGNLISGPGELMQSEVNTVFNSYAYVVELPSAVPEINAGSLSQALLILFALWLVTRRRAASHVA